MKCGDKGFKNALGQPCGQTISSRARACIWHSRDAQARRLLAAKGNVVSRLRRALPATYVMPELQTPEAVRGFLRDLAKKALTADVELRRISEARACASAMLAAFDVQAKAQMVEALLKLEHGGLAFAFLSRLQDGLAAGRSKPLPPLPGRTLAITEGETS